MKQIPILCLTFTVIYMLCTCSDTRSISSISADMYISNKVSLLHIGDTGYSFELVGLRTTGLSSDKSKGYEYFIDYVITGDIQSSALLAAIIRNEGNIDPNKFYTVIRTSDSKLIKFNQVFKEIKADNDTLVHISYNLRPFFIQDKLINNKRCLIMDYFTFYTRNPLKEDTYIIKLQLETFKHMALERNIQIDIPQNKYTLQPEYLDIYTDNPYPDLRDF